MLIKAIGIKIILDINEKKLIYNKIYRRQLSNSSE